MENDDKEEIDFEEEQFDELGLSNFLQDRIMAHKQHQYMLRATLKGEEQ